MRSTLSQTAVTKSPRLSVPALSPFAHVRLLDTFIGTSQLEAAAEHRATTMPRCPLAD